MIGLDTDPWGIPLFTDFQLEFALLIIILSLVIQPVFNPFHSRSSSPYTSSLSMRILGETVSKALLKSTYEIPAALLSSSRPATSSKKFIKLVKHDFLSKWRSEACWYYWLFSCPYFAWKWFPRSAAPSSSKGLRWSWLACGSLGPTSLPSRRRGWHLLCSSLQELLPTAMIDYRLSSIALQWYLPAPSVLMCASHQGPWIYMDPVCLSLPWPDPFPPRVHLCATFPLVSGTWDSWRPVLLLKTEAKEAFGASAFSTSCLTRFPISLSNRLTYSLAFLSSPVWL